MASDSSDSSDEIIHQQFDPSENSPNEQLVDAIAELEDAEYAELPPL